MKIVLVHPNSLDGSKRYQVGTLSQYPSRPPLGLLSLAAVLEKDDHTVKVFDNALYELPSTQLAGLVLGELPNAVGFSVTFKNLSDAKEIAAQIKRCNKNIITIFGGPQVSYQPEELIKNKNIDIIVIGEGELSLRQIVNNRFDQLKDVPNLVFKTNLGQVIKTCTGPPVEDLDVLPYPARHLVDFAAYAKKWPNVNPFTMSVGVKILWGTILRLFSYSCEPPLKPHSFMLQ
jgi:radical SAM superfamily enzyme YgiQ (UPF0313 family)